MENRYARGPILGLVLALAPCVQPAATAAVPPLTSEGLTASFDESGVLIEPTPLPGRWSWRYTLTSFGRPGLQLPAPPPVLTADAGKRELVRPGLREAYEVKDTIRGFEQTFIIEQPPPGKGSILLEGRVTTGLEPEGGIRLPNRVAYLRDGLPQLQYANLAVYDATGRALAARMDWTEDGQTISLWIDEEGQYPITVDPGIGSCGCQGASGNQCWCTAVDLCSGTDCVDPMHAALSPLTIGGSAHGAAFFYRTREPNNDYDQNNMIMFDMNTIGTSTAAAMLWNVSDPVDLACSGHSFLPDGRLFMAGGEFEDTEAQNDAYIWRDLPLTENALQAAADPSEMCGQPADLLSGCEADVIEGYDGNRWYPTTIPLWDGRIMVIGGEAQNEGIWNNSYEFYTPGEPPPNSTPGAFECNDDDFRVKDSAGENICPDFSETCAGCWDYPRYHAIPEGLFLAGQLHSTVLFSYADLETHSQLRRSNGPFSHMEEASRFESASVMLEVDLDATGYDLNQERRVLLVGGDGDGGNHLDTAEVFDAQATPLGWRWTGTGCLVGEDECENQEVMQRVRKYPKTVLLPNGLVLIVGGERNPENPGDHLGENSSEIFDPSNETFGSLLENGSGLDKDRRYHSQAFLLPDGRVITAGDDINTELGIVADENGATYNVYYPTYMSPASARPTILDWPEPPETIVWNDPFDVCASGIGVNGDDFHSVILVRPSSTTHSVDFDHRQVRLDAEVSGDCSGGKNIQVTLPEAPTWQKHVLPPGYYMLIVRKDNGVGNPPIPSVAKFVKLAEAP